MSRARRTKKAAKARTKTLELAEAMAAVHVHAAAAALEFQRMAGALRHVGIAWEKHRTQALKALGALEPIAGVCRSCGCTEDRACPAVDGGGCFWIDETQTRCSACFPVPAVARQLRKAERAGDELGRQRRRGS